MGSPEEIELCKASIVQRLAPCEIAVRGIRPLEHSRGATFQHDCYRASLDYLIDVGERPGLSLVHGKIQPGETDHAWIEFEEQDAVYDSTLLRFYRRPCYYTVRGAKSERKYSYLEAFRLYTEAGHYGPWHSTE